MSTEKNRRLVGGGPRTGKKAKQRDGETGNGRKTGKQKGKNREKTERKNRGKQEPGRKGTGRVNKRKETES
jgi:hypothetical protein